MWTGDRYQVSSVTALLSPATLRVDNGPFPVTAEQQEGSFGLRELGNPLAESGEIQTILWHETPFGEPCLPFLPFTHLSCRLASAPVIGRGSITS
jgi:hypothetical protein